MSTSDVELRLPAQSPFVSVLRMTTAGLAARLDFTLDDIEDLRMAVGEACALMLEHAAEGGSIVTRFELGEGQIRLTVSVDLAGEEDDPLDRDSFGWQVLNALVDDFATERTDNGYSISFTATSAKA